jgi:hypothetical protein
MCKLHHDTIMRAHKPVQQLGSSQIHKKRHTTPTCAVRKPALSQQHPIPAEEIQATTAGKGIKGEPVLKGSPSLQAELAMRHLTIHQVMVAWSSCCLPWRNWNHQLPVCTARAAGQWFQNLPMRPGLAAAISLPLSMGYQTSYTQTKAYSKARAFSLILILLQSRNSRLSY